MLLFELYIAMPQIIKISTNQEVISNRTAEFCCNATGKPIATFQWLRHGVQLSRKQINVAYSTVGSVCDDKDQPSVCNSSSTLQIFNTTATDGGEYTCVAINKIESVTTPVNLTVDGRVHFDSILHAAVLQTVYLHISTIMLLLSNIQ